MNCVYAPIGMEHFGRVVSGVLGWPLFLATPLGDNIETVYIVGMYDWPSYDRTLADTARANRRVIHWCGTDVMALTRPDLLPEATHLCESDNLKVELAAKGIIAKVATFPTRPMEVTPLPDEPNITFYAGSNSEKYGIGIVRFLMDAIPEARWLIYSYGQYTPEQMAEVIAASRVHVRFTDHDGSANSVRENLAAGRRVVATCDLPFVTRVSKADPAGIVRAIRRALSESQPYSEATAHYAAFNSEARYLADLEGVLS